MSTTTATTPATPAKRKSTFPGYVLLNGMTGGPVKKLQEGLNELRGPNATADDKRPLLEVDGEFGDLTEQRVRQFQASHGLQMDGEVGGITWARLFDEPVPPAPKKNLQERAYAVAASLLGTMEVGGNNCGPMVTRIIKVNGGTGPEPWCGDFVAYCYRLANCVAVGGGPQRLFAYVPWMTRLAGVKKTTSPVRGDIIRFNWNPGDGVPDHTGIFERWAVAGRTFYAIEGNTGKDPNVSDSTGGGDGVHRRLRSVTLVNDFLHVAR